VFENEQPKLAWIVLRVSETADRLRAREHEIYTDSEDRAPTVNVPDEISPAAVNMKRLQASSSLKNSLVSEKSLRKIFRTIRCDDELVELPIRDETEVTEKLR
jgi:hypothetical protein